MNCIVVPIYKDFEKLSNGELVSLSQLYNVLGKHNIFFIGPQNFNWGNFLNHAEKSNVFPKIKEFDLFYFESINGYNQLMTSLTFFKKFREYQYMLVYQLDAYVFKDELEYWCNKGYDYIGAPWFEGWHNADKSSEIIGVGNGGFSLRNIQSSIRTLNRVKFLQQFRRFWFKSHLQALWRFYNMVLFFKKYFHIRSVNEINTLLFQYPVNEDYYWTHFIAGTFTDYKVSEIEDAVKFSFEVNPALLYKMNNNQLPFGCHAWEKFEPEFWDSFIPREIQIESKNA